MKKTYLILLVSSLILFVIGMCSYDLFFQLIVPKNINLLIVHTSLIGPCKNELYYSIILGLMPSSLYLTWRLGKITLLRNRIISVIIVLLAIALALLIDLFMIHLVAGYSINDKIKNVMTVDNLKFTQFMFGGLLLGLLISWILFKQKIMK